MRSIVMVFVVLVLLVGCEGDDNNSDVSSNNGGSIINNDNSNSSDIDGDGHADSFDNCPNISNPSQRDTDNDGIGNACDSFTDSDGDGRQDDADNCPRNPNPSQTDRDGDGLGDPCDDSNEQIFFPSFDGFGLDYCREIGSNCGKPAADHYCKYRGYQRSLDFLWEASSPPTVVLKTGETCRTSRCDRITQVTCGGGAVTNTFIANPTVGTDSYALDYCREFATNCGEPAADFYCQSLGYNEVLLYTVSPDRPPTLPINDNRLCTDPGCDRIVDVLCSR